MSSELREIVDIGVALQRSGAETSLYRGSLEAGNFREALGKIDTRLSENPECLTTRLWWVRCHFEMGELPASALSTPLEEIATALEGEASLHGLGGGVYGLVGERLLSRGQSRLGVLMLERALQFASLADEVSLDDMTAMHSLFERAVDTEVKRAESKLSQEQYISELKRKKEVQSKALAARAGKQSCRSPKDKLESVSQESGEVKNLRFNSKSLLSEEFLGSDNVSEVSSSKPPGSSAARGVLVGMFCLVLVLGGISFFLGNRDESAVQLAMRMESGMRLDVDPPSLAAALPEESRGAHNLEAVETRLKELDFEPSEDSSDVGSRELGGSVVEGKKVEGSVDGPSESKVENPFKIETTFPEVVGSGVDAVEKPRTGTGNIPDNRTADDDNVPLLDPEALAKSRLEDLGKVPGSRGTVVNPRLGRGPDGKLYGPPPSVGSTDMAGRPLKSHPVNRFSSPRRYRTLTTTNVLEAPSLLSVVVGEIKENKTIEVVAAMGKWLELRSQQGRRGFIFAQDAKPIE